MAYIDSWGSTDENERKRLMETCRAPLCLHVRYAHGTAWSAASNLSKVAYTPGKCSIASCPCETFCESTPMSEDDILDMAALLKPEKVTLTDLGIGDLASLQCRSTVMRHFGGESITRTCIKDLGHTGDHTW